MNLPADDLVVIVGAGISFDAPTCAPGFGEIRDRFLRKCGFDWLVEEDPDEKGPAGKDRRLDVDHLAPEQIFDALDDKREQTKQQIRRDLWWLCETRGPNQNHKAVVDLIAVGAKVWTPNFDTMIERSAREGQEIAVVTEPGRIAAGPNVLMKPHGSFPRTGGKEREEPKFHDYDLLFESSEVWQLDPAWRAKLEEDCADRDVHLFGYRGADPDLTPAILAALAISRSAIWWDCDSKNLKRLARYVDPAYVQLEDGDPSAALRDLSRKRAGFVEEQMAAGAPEPQRGPEYKLRYEPTFESRAGLAGAISAAGDARRLRLKALVRDESPNRRKLVISLLRSTGYDWAPARSPIAFAFARGMRRSRAGKEDREGMAVLYLTLIDSRPLRRSDAKAIARVRGLDLGSSAQAAVRFASIEKLHGDLTTAREDAEHALAVVGKNPFLEGMTRYNLAWIYRQQGDLERRRGLTGEVEDLYAHIGPNWAAWIALDDALLALHAGDTKTAKGKIDGPFMKFVTDSIGHPAYRQDAVTAEALLKWHVFGPDHAFGDLEEELATRPPSRILPARYSSITTLLLVADNCRARGDLAPARRCLRRARSRALSMLQQSQIDLAEAFTDGDIGRLGAVEADARGRGFGLVAATAAAAPAALDGRPSIGELLVAPELPLPALY
jgi:hypothetical protein